MTRTFVLGTLLATGAVLTALPALNAQQPAAAPGLSAPQRVNGNVYVIQGNGGNTAAFVAANGIVLVDTKLANNGRAILDQVRTISDKPITHIINTHTHGDHNGSNQFFPATVEIVTHENTQANMQKMDVFQQAANKHGLPDRTFKDRLTLAERRRRDRPALLRRGAHQRRCLRGVQERARAARRRRVRQQGPAEHRPGERRQRCRRIPRHCARPSPRSARTWTT